MYEWLIKSLDTYRISRYKLNVSMYLGCCMNIAVIDDIEEETFVFREVLKEYSALNSTRLDVSCFGSAEKFLAEYVPLKYGVIVLDIYMGGITGIEAAKK